MALHRSLARLAPRRRGASLLESLVALVVVAGSTVAVGPLQGRLRLDADLTRQRSEAVALAEAEIEGLRAFSSLGAASGTASYAGIGDAERTVAAGNAAYRVVRRVDAAWVGARQVSVQVQWNDRGGTARALELASFIAGSDPAYAGAMALAPSTGGVPTATRGAFGRAPSMPLGARDLGDGRSAWKPSSAGTLALVYDNASGDVVARCSVAAGALRQGLATADLAACSVAAAHLVSGTIRFAPPSSPGAVLGSAAPLAVTVAMRPAGASRSQPPDCTTEARKTVRYISDGSLHIDAVSLDALPASRGAAAWDDTGDRHVAWTCLAAPRADGQEPGRVDLVPSGGWTIGTGSADHRVCRYASARTDRRIDVSRPVTGRNFLVVAGTDACPAGAMSDSGASP